MKKPTKPTETLPSSFGGIKENFTDDKQATGYEPDVPDILGGANLNYTIDTIGKKDIYHDAINDFINAIPIDNTIVVDSNNDLQYEDISDVVKYEPEPENLPTTTRVILKNRAGEYIAPYSNANKGQGYQLFDLKFSDHILMGTEATGWALCGDYTLTTDVEFYQTCVAEKEAGTEGTTTLADITFTSYTNANGHIYYDISEKDKVDQIYANTGSAWFYGIDTTNERIFLPRNDNFVQNTIDTTKVNNFTDAGLPNVQGYFDTYVNGSGVSVGTRNSTGAFYPKGTGSIFNNSDTGEDGLCGMNFDASRSSSVYGNSTSVQPRSLKQLCYMCVGNTIYNEEKIDVEKLEGDVRSLQNQFSNIHLDRNIGEIVESTLPLVDAGLHLLDGALIVGGGIYDQFVQYIAKLYNKSVFYQYAWVYNDGSLDHTIYTREQTVTSDTKLYTSDGELYTGSDFTIVDGVIQYSGNATTYTESSNITVYKANYFTDEDSWQSSVTTYGSCGKFVYNSSANTVRLPKVSDILQGTTDTSALGDLIEAGLPNITGTVTFVTDLYSAGTNSLVSSSSDVSSNKYISTASGKSRFVPVQATLDASLSNSIYGNSDTVQPQTIKVLYYIVIATSTKTDVQVDLDNVATELNSKVDKADLAEVQCVVETYVNGTSGYRIWSDGYCEQWGKPSIANASSATVTLLKTYLTTDYVITNGLENSSGTTSRTDPITISSVTTSSFLLSHQASASMYCNWHTEGYIEV